MTDNWPICDINIFNNFYRIGGASTLATAGIPDTTVKVRGKCLAIVLFIICDYIQVSLGIWLLILQQCMGPLFTVHLF